uniref:Uncharacterized protein n=1 Tax=Arundo donax TaxID=35708 RepID=A0A0A9G7T7_ARUDO
MRGRVSSGARLRCAQRRWLPVTCGGRSGCGGERAHDARQHRVICFFFFSLDAFGIHFDGCLLLLLSPVLWLLPSAYCSQVLLGYTAAAQRSRQT